MKKIGRNDPCPCGSGKKYKHCCYGKEVTPFVAEDAWKQDPEWYRIRLTEAEVIFGILKFGRSNYGDDFIAEALFEFCIWGEFEPDEKDLESLMMPWVAFTWGPEGDGEEPEIPMGLDYLAENDAQLDDHLKEFILAACYQPFSFFAVTEVVIGKSLGLRDIFLDRTFMVKEAKASQTLKRGDIIFARVVPIDDQAIIVGCSSTTIPPNEHGRLLDIRDELKEEMSAEGYEMSQESMVKWDLEVRAIYLDAVEYLANPRLPTLQNTDGDPISFVKLYFELNCSPEEALDALSPLALYQSPEEIIEDATHDDDGNLVEVRFSWLRKGNKKNKSWDNTVLGSLEIKGDTLIAEVNSERRAKKIQAEVAKRLGERVAFKRALHESVESKFEEMNAQSGSPAFEQARKEREELESRPEVQAILKKQMEAHWKEWYKTRIPALQNKTPLQAARTKAGRERLEALLIDFERRNENVPHASLRFDVEAARKKLGL
ncbi:MAG TPA: SEC-C metal-binding domain-containing protein [Blastocatellia bacterium]|nr:SEC-C metal-binding domain-containing protein [Blastocatellia bacterium]